MGRVGIEPTTHGFSVHLPSTTTGDAVDSSKSAKNSLPAGLPPNLQNDAELNAVLDAWPRLPAALRAGIVAIVKSAR
jgi:hypothetical protein